VKERVDLYDSHYEQVEADVYQAVRAEAFGDDLGQTSWITAAECDELCRWLGLEGGQDVLEVACVSVRVAEKFGASVTGIDINESAVSAAQARAAARGLSDRTEFRLADADEALPFPDGSFDALFCNDSINHFRDRRRTLEEWYRVIRPGGRCLYTDPIVMTGCLSNAEIEARSSIGFFLFTPPRVNEEFLRQAGFRVVLTADLTESMADMSRRWHEARAKRREELSELEGEEKFEELQDFLSMVHTLASEHRLSRFAYMGQK